MASQLPTFRQSGSRMQNMCYVNLIFFMYKPIFQTLKMPSRRDAFLKCKFFDHQAREGSQGSAGNSSDDANQPDMEYVSQGRDHPDGDRDMYLWSLGSQVVCG
jgi:hypothetical protein